MSMYFNKRLSYILPEGLYRSWWPLSRIGYCILYEKCKRALKISKKKQEFQQNIGRHMEVVSTSCHRNFFQLFAVREMGKDSLTYTPYIISNFDNISCPLPFSESERSCFRGT